MGRGEDDLTAFVREALARGQSRDEISGILVAAGWPREQIVNALRNFAEVDFPIPVPRPRPQLSASEAFIYLLVFSTLCASATSLGSLLFSFIDRAFPDPALDANWSGYVVRRSVATLVIAFPIFVLASRHVRNMLAANPVRRASPVRKWLTYLAIYVAAIVVIGDLVAVVYNLLGGELTARFVLKALTVGLIGGGIVAWYLPDIRRDESES
ncbi:MAG TPA: DUF5671 domain-containing protein [Devosiaceae bacterium]